MVGADSRGELVVGDSTARLARCRSLMLTRLSTGRQTRVASYGPEAMGLRREPTFEWALGPLRIYGIAAALSFCAMVFLS